MLKETKEDSEAQKNTVILRPEANSYTVWTCREKVSVCLLIFVQRETSDHRKRFMQRADGLNFQDLNDFSFKEWQRERLFLPKAEIKSLSELSAAPACSVIYGWTQNYSITLILKKTWWTSAASFLWFLREFIVSFMKGIKLKNILRTFQQQVSSQQTQKWLPVAPACTCLCHLSSTLRSNFACLSPLLLWL